MARFGLAVGWRAFAVSASALALIFSSFLRALWPDADLLVPLLLIIATVGCVRAARVPATRPAVAFTAVFLALLWAMWTIVIVVFAGQVIPRAVAEVMGEVALVWPQYVFFGGTLYAAQPNGGPIVPTEAAGIVMVLFWAAVGCVFVFVARRVRSLAILFALALAMVAGITGVVVALAPRLGWRFVLDLP